MSRRYVVTFSFDAPDDVDETAAAQTIGLVLEDASQPVRYWPVHGPVTVHLADDDTVRVEAYRRKDGRWAWRAVDASNGQIVGTDGGQGYEHHDDCTRMAEKVTGRTPIVVLELELQDGAGTSDDIELT